MNNWIEINEEDYTTYPEEGYEVLVTNKDGDRFDVAWYIKSTTYKWLKYNHRTDNNPEFKAFKIKKWKYIDGHEPKPIKYA